MVANEVGGQMSYRRVLQSVWMLTPGRCFRAHGAAPHDRVRDPQEHLGAIALACRERQPQSGPRECTPHVAIDQTSPPVPSLVLFCCTTSASVRRRVRVGGHECRARPATVPSRPHSYAPGAGERPRVQPGMMFPILTRESITSLPPLVLRGAIRTRRSSARTTSDVAQFYDCLRSRCFAARGLRLFAGGAKVARSPRVAPAAAKVRLPITPRVAICRRGTSTG